MEYFKITILVVFLGGDSLCVTTYSLFLFPILIFNVSLFPAYSAAQALQIIILLSTGTNKGGG